MATHENETTYFFRGHLSLHPEHGVKFTQNPPKSVQSGSRVMAIAKIAHQVSEIK